MDRRVSGTYACVFLVSRGILLGRSCSSSRTERGATPAAPPQITSCGRGSTSSATGPPYSPDLNHIERLWKKMNERVAAEGACETVEQLKARAREVWKGFTDDELSGYVLCFSDKVKKCVANGGD